MTDRRKPQRRSIPSRHIVLAWAPSRVRMKVPPPGLEPGACDLAGRCSVRLSYGGTSEESWPGLL
jgi:hypothetical protein